jgi:hypothetical protein
MAEGGNPRRWVVTTSERGTGQGSVALLANVYLHYVFDLWAERWRRCEASGDMIIAMRERLAARYDDCDHSFLASDHSLRSIATRVTRRQAHLLISAFCFGVKCWDEGSIPHFFAPLDDLPSAATVATGCTDDLISWLALSFRIDGPSSSSR